MTREKSLDLKKLTGFLNLIGKRLKKVLFFFGSFRYYSYICTTKDKLKIMKQFTKKQLQEKVKVTCYNKTETMTRGEAINKFYEGMLCCEGSEGERYTTIYCQLLEGSKNVSDRY